MSIQMQPFFLKAEQGALFALYYPAQQFDKNKVVLHIPAFSEEMNCARHIVSKQSRLFAEKGYSVLVIDLFGTGDSEGKLSDASWDDWKSNVFSAYQWLRQQGADSIILWSLRLGSLLAMDCIASFSSMNVERLIAWQPVLKGDLFISQLLRLKVVSSIMDNSVPSLKLGDLKQRLLGGEEIEVGGYLLTPALTNVIFSLNAMAFNLSLFKDITLFEIVADENTLTSLANMQLIEYYLGCFNADSIKTVVGTDFWSTHGVRNCDELFSSTLTCCL